MRTTLVFMAAGFGSRFSGGVKQLEPVGPNGEVLMDYAVHDALAAGFSRVVFVTRRDIVQDFRSSVGGRVEKKCDVDYVYQELSDLPEGFAVPEGRRKPWGTGQAVLACRNTVHEPFCVLNADDYYGPTAFRRIHAHLTELRKGDGLDCCMAGYVLGNTLSESGAVTRGICHADAHGRLNAIQEQHGVISENGRPCIRGKDGLYPINPRTLVSMNIWGMPAEFIDYVQEMFPEFLRKIQPGDMTAEFLLPTIVGNMIRSGRGSVQVIPTEDRWFGMTYAEDKRQAREQIRALIDAGKYPEKL